MRWPLPIGAMELLLIIAVVTIIFAVARFLLRPGK